MRFVIRAAPFVALGAVAARAESPTTAPATQPAPLRFIVTFDKKVHDGPYTGRVWVMTTTSNRGEPRRGPVLHQPDPFLSIEARDWKPGEPLVIDADAPGFPAPLGEWLPDRFRLQAVMDIAGEGRKFPAAAGNGYSEVITRRVDPARGGEIHFHIDRVTPHPRLINDPRLRLVEIPSPLLSDFYGRPVSHRAAICLPPDYDVETERRFPTLYDIPPFGFDFRHVLQYRKGLTTIDQTFAVVVLDPNGPLGHHAFADSANNGPRARALVQEFIPHLEREFRLIADPHARYLTGYGAGGWAALWLQINYPDLFNGVWAIAPLPVDFRSFYDTDIYAIDANLYLDDDKQQKPYARHGNRPVLFFQRIAEMEHALGPGGQIGSYEAVFSPRGPNGRPRPLFDRRTGAVDPEVARAWRNYDLNVLLQDRWDDLGPKLADKLHIVGGGYDTYYFERPLRLLASTLHERGGLARIVIVEGRNHQNVLITPEVEGRFDAILERYRLAFEAP
jgi:hypothetical protein